MLDFLKRGVKKIGEAVTGAKRKMDDADKLDLWQERLGKAINAVHLELMDEREAIYQGTHEADRHVDAGPGKPKQTNNVRNVAYEMVESQIDTTIPQPSVKAKRRGIDHLAEMVEDSLKADILGEVPIQRINDQMERIVPVQGACYVLVDWNPDYTHREFVGELQLSLIHPKQFIPQPGVYEIQEMDYFFLLFSVTRGYIKRRFDVELDEDETEEYPYVNTLELEEGKQSYLLQSQGEKVTLIVSYYRDDEGEIGRICWVNDVLLEDSPRFFHRRHGLCEDCGTSAPQDAKECPRCGGKVKATELEAEPILEDMVLEPLVYNKSVRQVAYDLMGNPSVIEDEQEVIEERIIPAGTEVPYYTPKRYPIAVRINTPKNFSLGGISDIDIIRDQQDAIKKILSKMESKILLSGSYLTAPKSMKIDFNNYDDNILRVKDPSEAASLAVHTLQASVSQDMGLYDELYKAAQSTLGIHDSYQGKRDTTATSGKAKEIQVQRTAGRLLSKSLNKFDFYKQLFEIMMEFKLAFYDETRPFIKQDVDGTDDWGDFNKYEFLLQDKQGEWFYCTDFIITADSGQGIPNDKMWLYEQVIGLYGAQAVDLVQLWQVLEQLKFPSASQILSQIKAKIDEAEQMQEAMMEQQAMMGGGMPNEAGGVPGQPQGLDAILSQLDEGSRQRVQDIIRAMSPEAQQAFMSLPPDLMEDALLQAMQG